VRALPSPLRKQLETSVLAARCAAEIASRAVIEGLGVFLRDKPGHLDAAQAALRNGLRQKWRQFGGDEEAKPLLVAECAYEQWHRLLFARFLAENGLLLHPQYKAPVTLGDCDELAAELGEPDGWSVAARFAAEILPGIFRLDDPCVRLRLAPEGRHALEQILDGLPAEVFAADDALGWVYQFWQKDQKDEVNASERKIGGADLGPVTQLFTENYMVRFLLENSLGAWWVAHHPDSLLVKEFEYLRLDENGQPAVDSFDGWPDRVAEVTVMDPCCGSGHFLVEAFSMLWQMRAEEECIAPTNAQDAVLRNNLFGLEIDPRCVQITTFAVALQAWKAGGGWRPLPIPNIACSGIPVKAPVDEWRKLAGGDESLENALSRLHILFRDADTLGSLIDPRRTVERADPTGLQGSFDDAEWDKVAGLLPSATAAELHDPAIGVLGADAVAIARAADYLSRQYNLVLTNVPYLTRRRQTERLRAYCASHFAYGKDDLATAFLLRCRSLTADGGNFQLVLPQAWTNLRSYKRLRELLLAETTPDFVIKLGPGAFSTITGEVVNVVLASFVASVPGPTASVWVCDLEGQRFVRAALQSQRGQVIPLTTQLANPDSIISYELAANGPLLSKYTDGIVGMMTGDSTRFIRKFWEIDVADYSWSFQQSTVTGTEPYSGREHVMLWQGGRGIYREYVEQTAGRLGGAPFRGGAAWGNRGISISQMAPFRASLYTGELFDNNAAVILPRRPDLLAPIWHFCRSGELERQLRTFNSSMKVEASTLVKVPFDLEHWRQIAAAAGPLPEPWSDDPTQWLFDGRPEGSTAPLHVAVGRLIGYRWPSQLEQDEITSLADLDGIVCLPSVVGKAPAADRLQQVLAVAFGDAWPPAKVKELLVDVGSSKKSLGEWMRDDLFKQHCALFGNRPFVWHIWDGLKDGFSALVDYHRLDYKTLEKLTYTYLGQDWVERQRAEVRDEVAGAEVRLSAALNLRQKLELILDGEAPYDIYVRWKEPHEQPIGWEPDLNDGVRLNIRPFVEAGVLRSPFNIHWRKDRGKNPDGSERHNDIHLTLSEKREARTSAGRS
jgi:hypothetical protein